MKAFVKVVIVSTGMSTVSINLSEPFEIQGLKVKLVFYENTDFLGNEKNIYLNIL
jgi:hypothetical protein